jgi:hypothetical protein
VLASLAIVAVLIAPWGVPLLPGSAWKPAPDETPIAYIVILLGLAVGAPYFVIATTSPRLQAWFAGRYPTTSPYRLYALSNAGSLLALLTYPAFFEVWLPLRSQAWLWTMAFVAFAGGVVACALFTRVAPMTERAAAEPDEALGRAAQAPPTPSLGDWLTWTALAAVSSALLLPTTNYMSQEIAVIPLLWIAPLSAYLPSFALRFDSVQW